MRAAGAVSCPDLDGTPSLRTTEERFQKWREANAPTRLGFAERLLPPSLWRQPAEQKRSARHLSFVYFIASDDAHVKIGYTGDIDQRLASLQNATPAKLRVLAMMHGAVAVERELHEAFGAFRIHGEWFRREGALAELLENAPK